MAGVTAFLVSQLQEVRYIIIVHNKENVVSVVLAPSDREMLDVTTQFLNHACNHGSVRNSSHGMSFFWPFCLEIFVVF